MRILAFTDIHGSYSKVEEVLGKESPFDAIIIGGDLTTNGTQRETGAAVRRFAQFNAPVLVVAGNMDPPALERTLNNLGVYINAKGVILDDVGFFGVSGSPFTPMHTPYEISEDEIRERAEAGWKQVQAARWKVFVSHAPPRNTKLDRIFLSKHVGSTTVRNFIEQCQPDVVICGHIHEARGLDAIGKTKMVNCGPAGKGYYAVVDIGDEVDIRLRG